MFHLDGLSGEQLKESLSRIDMKKCTVSSLRRASQNAGIPSDILAKAALDLCDGLQEKLDVSARIIQVWWQIETRDTCNLSITKLKIIQRIY